MNSNRCLNCGFLNFASATACKRCRAAFDETPSAETAPQSDPYSTGGWQGGYELAAAWPQPAYQPSYFPTPVAALPARSKGGGANVLLWVLLCGALVVAAAIGFLWKFNKPASDNFTWQEVKPPDNSFTVSMPVKPVESTNSVGPNIQMHSWTGNMNKDGFYAVAYADYPGAGSSKISSSSLLDSAAQGAAGNSGAQIVGKKNITLSGYPGIETDMDVPESAVPGGGKVACRIYWVTPRIYIVCAGGPESSPVYTSRAKFLDSFRFTK